MSKQTQIDLIDICENNHGGVAESQLAHERIRKGAAAAMRVKILRFITEMGAYGVTAYDVTVHLGIRQATASARMSELKRDGFIHHSGERRKTDTGSYAGVFVLEEYL